MFAIPGICALIFFIFARPQEYFESLQKVPLLYIFCAAALGGFIVDLRLRKLQPIAAPTLPIACMFLGWCVVCDIARTPDQLIGQLVELAILFVLYATIAHAVQGFRAFQVVAGCVMITCLGLAFVCAHQGYQDHRCVAIDEGKPGEGVPDDRPCETAEVCYGRGAEPGNEYVCERVGLFRTFTVEDRVRYRGDLQDPNEMALTITTLGASLLVAFAIRKRNGPWTFFAILGCMLVAETVIESQSRGGLVVMLIVAAVYFVKRYGPAGLIAGAVLGAPLMMLGGRSGESADESTQLRYEAWDAGLRMFKGSPVFGVGHRQFGEYFFLTAHNSYVLTLAELGMVGQVLFVSLLFLNFKMLWIGIRDLSSVPGAEAARTWGLALFAALCAITFQIFTLSFAYHPMLWIFFGFCGAWASAVRRHRPDFTVKLVFRDVVMIVIACLVFTFLVLPLYLRYKGA
ncbi:MAG TPA: O-antigen ligase family protein [Kofleriaceae bacterium]|nr:O-antigen ligase family protein [Kofleriaceae bacterium]